MDDEELIGRIGAAFAGTDPVPARVRAAALAAFAARLPEAAFAELSADSSEEVSAVPAGIRGRNGPRLLTFGGAGVTVEIEVSGEGTVREIAGRLTPPAPADVAVRHPQGEMTAQAGEAGHFVVAAVPAGPISLVFVLTDASSIVTSWVRL
jgi:hypothetical protein